MNETKCFNCKVMHGKLKDIIASSFEIRLLKSFSFVHCISCLPHRCSKMAGITVKGPIECFYSRDYRPYWFTETNEILCIKIEFNSQRFSLGHQHGRHFFVLGHHHGRCDVMLKHSIEKAVHFVNLSPCLSNRCLIYVQLCPQHIAFGTLGGLSSNSFHSLSFSVLRVTV